MISISLIQNLSSNIDFEETFGPIKAYSSKQCVREPGIYG